jgi:ferritin-like metal-binding protein YciE
MFERLNTPRELYDYKLQAALKMEQTVIGMLEENISEAEDDAVRAVLEHHLGETRQQVENLEHVFTLLRADQDTSPCPAIQGLEKEGKANVKKTDAAVADLVILQGAAETEHHEIAVYENLIALGRAIGREDTVSLLRANLRQEQQALQKVAALLGDLAAKKASAWVEELVEIAPREDD